MLNLKELEEELDRAIENSTAEELNEWLLKKKTEEISAFLAEGRLETIPAKSVTSFKQSVCFQTGRPPMQTVTSYMGLCAA